MAQSHATGKDGTTISNAQLAKSFIVSAERLTYSKDRERRLPEKADLIERRLQHIEEALRLGVT
ncbi:hypothetical protein D884_03159 [Pseudomonas sp. URMO17WK12:I10]|uniref:hypothetical protein n=1 Tax=unclassified Pseudomonas TaxID=196821 RepID=UPI0004890805|nr:MULTISPECIES: hypothetical protein [unclassified Pseudomonas]RDL17090.1 hypothetical protein F633_03503 [Pseudomonas sp. LAMO17WK12:I3]RED05048.1 hypothetical protein D884_03159 [Pseudomonas sp. URMO17WK12:I10]SOD08401.1 hypothetical protein SAMN05660967_01643 [Pseudomonas sp. URMO17WK12:I9]